MTRLLAVLMILSLPVLIFALGVMNLMPFGLLPAVMLGSALVFGGHDRPAGSPGSDEDDDDGGRGSGGGEGGGGGGPHPPRVSPDNPRGGIPLPDAEQPRWRLRDHRRPQLPGRTRERRPARDPAKRPARDPAKRPAREPTHV